MPLPRKLVDEVQAAAKRPENVAMQEKMNEILTGDKTSSFTLGDFTGKTGLTPGDLVTDARNNTVIIKGVPAHTPAELEILMRKQTARWKQKNGTTVRICDMSDRHLSNTIAMLERATQRHDDAFATAPNPFHGDIAFSMMEDAQDAILEGDVETDPSDVYPIYDKLCAERDRRISNARNQGLAPQGEQHE